MDTNRGKGLWILLAALLCAACGGLSNEPPTGQLSQGLTGENGMTLNGMMLNGLDWNGIMLNGLDWNGIMLNGVSLNGTSLEAVLDDGTLVSGEDFIGTEFDAILTDGSSVRLRIDDIRRHPDPSNQDVLLYSISAEGDEGVRVPLCHAADGSPVEATVVAGRWDFATGEKISSSTDEATFACVGIGAIAKCMMWGYKPWVSVGGISLEDSHQACTRMVRADYCGDGTPHTVNGTPIDIYDAIGVQSPDTDWPVDAEWGPNGALCVNNPRSANPEDPPPGCIAERELRHADCGTITDGSLQYGGLLADKYQGRQR